MAELLPRRIVAVSLLPTVLAAALLIRVAVALCFWNVVAPDEVFQFLEQAHRLVFGQGVVPWEFQVGLRCWLIPLLLAAPMALAHLVDPDPLAGLIFIRILLCIASLSIVWCAVKWGERFYGRRGAWIAGMFTAVWPDLWLMAPHPLEETLAAYVLVPAVYLISKPDHDLRRIAWAGFLLGVAFTFRVQLAPAIAIAGIALCGKNFLHWRVALLAAALPVLIAGMLDWFTWGQPFRSFWLNIYLNVFLGVAKQEFGASPPDYFVYMMAVDWLWTFPVLLFLVWKGSRPLRLPAVMALVIILTHSLIAHKEYRFIFPAIALAAPLAGIGLAGVWTELRRAGLLRWRRYVLAAVLLAGPLISPFTYFMLRWQTNSFQAFRTLTAWNPTLVSVEHWDRTFLPFDILFPPSIRLTSRTDVLAAAGIVKADTIVASELTPGIPSDFTKKLCVRGNWIPFAKTPTPRLCIWIGHGRANPTGTPPPFEFPFPQAAKLYMVRDRLMDVYGSASDQPNR